jgi:signal recognition particle receptor subunit beta
MQLKILVTGAFNAGKTEFIRAVSEIEPVTTEKRLSIGSDKKQETTVAMDFGRITIDEDLVLYLFGTPGQDRFDFMWDLLSEGILGYIVMVDSCDAESLAHTKKILEFFDPVDVPFVVAANKQDTDGALDVSEIRTQLALSNGVQVLPCVAPEKDSVKGVLLSLLFEVMNSLDE